MKGLHVFIRRLGQKKDGKKIYRASHLVIDLGWVDFGLVVPSTAGWSKVG